KIFFAKHNLSSFKFSTKVCERDMLVNTPILEAYINKEYTNSLIIILKDGTDKAVLCESHEKAVIVLISCIHLTFLQ
ncbi:hypothetical protein, partial [Phocaeicola coprocola]|uniref:hypothetical protein n=1 Tax=Phocaeicola coprocola TaxID=310298 RepID=UPI001C38F3AB